MSLVASWLHTRRSRRQLRRHEEAVTELKARLYEKSRQGAGEKASLRALAPPREDKQGLEGLHEASTQLALVQVAMEASLRTLQAWIRHENLGRIREASLRIVTALADGRKVICLGSEDTQDHAAQLSKQLNQLGERKDRTHAVCLLDTTVSPHAAQKEDKTPSLLRGMGKAGDVLFLMQGDSPYDPSPLLRTAKEEGIHTIRLGHLPKGQATGDVDIAMPVADDGENAQEIHPIVVYALVRLTETLLSLRK